jgi:lysophospholipase
VNESESTFPGPAGALFRRSVVPAGPWCSLAIIHGYGDHSGRHLLVMRWLGARGVACHAVDLRGQGRSAGRRGFLRGWDEYVDDLDAFLGLAALREHPPLFLLGHSHGGLVLTAAAIRGLRDVRGCILTSPFFRNRMTVPPVKRLLARAMNPLIPWLRVRTGLSDGMMTSDPAMIADTAADPLVVRMATPRWYFGSLEAQRRVLADAPRFTHPLLLLCGGADPIADVSTAEAFFHSAGSADKTMKVYPGLLHEILREVRREEVSNDILTWLRQRVPGADCDQQGHGHESMPVPPKSEQTADATHSDGRAT